MSLAYILSEVAADTGYHPDTSDADRAYLINKINKAAKELHEARDLVFCNRERLFSLDASTQQVAFPNSFGKARAFRNYYTRREIIMHDMRPRYQTAGWTENLLTARLKYRSPLQRAILNFAPITLTIPKAEPTAFSVVLSGPTVHSGRINETVTFAPGEISKQTATAFSDLLVFGNVKPHLYDVTATDTDGNVLSVLPNFEWQASYLIFQMLDYVASAPSAPYIIEGLYKVRFQPFADDMDEFVCPGYDDAIIWQTRGQLAANSDVSLATAYGQKAAQLCSQMADDEQEGVEMRIDFKENKTLSMFKRPQKANGSMFPGNYLYP